LTGRLSVGCETTQILFVMDDWKLKATPVVRVKRSSKRFARFLFISMIIIFTTMVLLEVPNTTLRPEVKCVSADVRILNM